MARGKSLDPRSILVRMPNWLGDAVMATVVPMALKAHFPGAKLTVLGRPAHEDLLRGLPCLDAFLGLEKHKGVGAIWRQGRRLKGMGFDLGVVLPNSLSSAALVFLARIPHRIGYDLNHRGLLLTRKTRPAMVNHRRVPTPMTEYYMELLTLLGVEPQSRRPELVVVPDEEAELEDYLADRPLPPGQGPLVLLNPGASFGPSKLWRGGAFAEVGDRLQAEIGARIVILAGPGEAGLAREISGAMKRPHLGLFPEVLRLGGLKALVKKSDILITTDTGPRHLAVAFDRPVVVLMGATDPRYTHAHLEKTTVIRKEVSCSPCHLKVCPIDHRCMEKIKPGEVVESARMRLGL